MSFVLLFAAGYVVGDWALKPCRFRDDLESVVYRLLAGLCLCGLFLLAVGSYSLSVAQLVINAVALFGFGYKTFRNPAPEPAPISPVTSSPRFSLIEWFSVLALVAAVLFALVSALAPATGWDATVAHLSLPKDYYREGRIGLIEGNEYSAYPHLLHCLFAYAFTQGAERGVTLLSWSLGLLLCASVYLLGKRIENRKCGVIAAAILATAPIFLDQSGTASVDLAFCALATAALACLVAWREEQHRPWLILAAFFAGSSCGVRHTGYLVSALLLIATPLLARERRIHAAALFGFAALLAAAPWLARSAWLVGNPFYPFFDGFFGSSRMPHWRVAGFGAHSTAADTSLARLLAFPWEIIMKPQAFDGWSKSPGALVLLLGVPGLFAGGRRARGLGAFAAAGLIAFFYFERLARYLLPFFVPLMVVAALAACRLRSLRYVIGSVLVVTFLYGLALDVAAVHFKIPVVFGRQEADAYLKDRVERYAAFQWVNGHIPYDETVFTFDRRAYYFNGRTFQNDEPLRRLSNLPVPEQAAWFRAHDIHWIFLPLTYIEESPGLRDPFLAMAAQWRQSRRWFAPAYSEDLRRPHKLGTEHVEIYEVRYDNAAQ